VQSNFLVGLVFEDSGKGVIVALLDEVGDNCSLECFDEALEEAGVRSFFNGLVLDCFGEAVVVISILEEGDIGSFLDGSGEAVEAMEAGVIFTDLCNLVSLLSWSHNWVILTPFPVITLLSFEPIWVILTPLPTPGVDILDFSTGTGLERGDPSADTGVKIILVDLGMEFIMISSSLESFSVLITCFKSFSVFTTVSVFEGPGTWVILTLLLMDLILASFLDSITVLALLVLVLLTNFDLKFTLFSATLI